MKKSGKKTVKPDHHEPDNFDEMQAEFNHLLAFIITAVILVLGTVAVSGGMYLSDLATEGKTDNVSFPEDTIRPPPEFEDVPEYLGLLSGFGDYIYIKKYDVLQC